MARIGGKVESNGDASSSSAPTDADGYEDIEDDDVVAAMWGTLYDYKFTAKGHYTVTFEVPATQTEAVKELNRAHQMVVQLYVVKRRKKGKGEVDLPLAPARDESYEGVVG